MEMSIDERTEPAVFGGFFVANSIVSFVLSSLQIQLRCTVYDEWLSKMNDNAFLMSILMGSKHTMHFESFNSATAGASCIPLNCVCYVDRDVGGCYDQLCDMIIKRMMLLFITIITGTVRLRFTVEQTVMQNNQEINNCNPK